MKTWQRFGAVNAGALAGIFVSIFFLPPATPVWVWAIVAVVALAMLNYVLIRKVKTPQAPTPGKQKVVTIIVFVGFLLFLIDMALRYTGRPR